MIGENQNKRTRLRQRLVGKWVSTDPDSRVVYEVVAHGKGISIRVFDETDREMFIVERQKWKGNWMHFDLFVPSTKWRTHNRLTLLGHKRALCEFAYKEEWEREVGAYKPAKRTSLRNGAVLIGKWHSKNNDSPTTLEIKPVGRKVVVHGYDAVAKRKLSLLDRGWDGSSLRFNTRLPNGSCVAKSRLIPLSRNRLIHEITMPDILARFYSSKGAAAVKGSNNRQ